MASHPAPHRLHVLKATTLVIATLTIAMIVPSLAAAEPSPTIEQVEATIEQLGQEAERASEAYNAAEIAQDEGRRKLAQLNATISTQEADLKALQGTMAGFAAAMYKSGGVDTSMSLLVADDPGQFLAQAASLDSVSRRHADTFRQISVARQRLTQDQAVASQQQVKLKAVQQELAEQKDAVEAKIAEQQQVLDSLNAEQRRRLEERRRQEAASSAERASLAQATRADRPVEAQPDDDSAPADAAPASERGRIALAWALTQVGKPYRWGAEGPDAYDCSGLTMAAFREAGVSLPHHSGSQYAAGRKISQDEVQPGDLIYYYSPISHVGIYMGDGQMVHASTSGAPVKISTVYWDRFVGASRP